MTIRRIVVGTDFSEGADAARLQALNIAAATGAAITLVHVVVPPELWVDTVTLSLTGGVDSDAIVQTETDAARAKLEELAGPTGHEGVKVDVRVDKGHADTLLPKIAAEVGADLLIVGTHGRTGFKRLTLGSVAERVVRRTECSVLVARPNATAAGGFRRILVPHDFSDTADKALTFATALVADDGVIDVAHYWQTAFAAYGYYTGYEPPEVYRTRISGDVTTKGDALLARFKQRHANINFLQAADSGVRGIHKQLEEADYDLVAMGSHGRRGFRRWIVGSVAENTVRHANCSVLVAHSGGDEP